ncbi:MAG TPA: M14 family metallopeptidase, partial [Niastella sp.]|nr:M14 family metallopeptidase [Niastella sp.]
MKLLKTGLFVICIIITSIAQAQEKYSTVKIYTQSVAERNELIGLLQIDHFIPERNAIIAEIGAGEVAKLRLRNVKFDVLVDDVVKNLEMQNRRYFANRAAGIEREESRVPMEQSGKTVDAIIKKPAAFEVKNTFGGYYNFAEMEAAMNTLVANYSTIATKTSIGKTAAGRDLWLIKISDNPGTDETGEPEVLYLGLQHAREAITGASMIFFMQYLCENYATDERIKNLVDNREIYIVPCFNPDGWEYNRTSMSGNAGGSWRKNRSYDSTVTITKNGNKNSGYTYDTTVSRSYYGVDLNRNWGVDWGNCNAPILGNATSCGSNVESDETYYGPSAFSELENQAIRDFTKAHHIVAGFDQHAYGPYYSLPFGRKIAGRTMSVKGQNFYTTIPALMGTYNGMRAADSYDALGYEVAGGFKDWMLMGDLGSSIGTGRKDSVWAMTGEGAAGGGSPAFASMANFWAPAGQIEYLSKGMCYQNLQLAYAAGTYVDIQDANDIV